MPRRPPRIALVAAMAVSLADAAVLARPSAAPAALPRGIYLYREQLTNDAQFDQALGVPGVDGMALVLDWSAIQPSRDAFDTATIDAQLALARQHKLPVELVLRAGRSVPGWVAPSAQLKLAYAPHLGLSACSAVTMPPPWNANYQRAFAAIVQRTADYVRAKGVTISVVKLTGINATSEELRVPAETRDATKDCPGGAVDDVAIWQAAHYTPSKMVDALGQLAAAFAKIFPAAPVTLALIPGRGFPPIDESQHVVTGRAIKAVNDDLLQSLVGAAAKPLSGRLILQHDFLISGQPADATVVDLARQHRAYLAWQTNLWRGNMKQGAACGGQALKGTACSDDQYLALLQTGIRPAGGNGPSAQGLYIEVFAYDALAHRAAIAQAHAALTTGAR